MFVIVVVWQLLMYSFTNGEAQYRTDIEDSMKAWSKAGGMDYTPKCLAFRLQWGALRYSGTCRPPHLTTWLRITAILIVSASYYC